MTPRRSSRLLGTVVVLGLALVVTGILAGEAEVAARGHRQTAERTLSDYALFAGWQFEQQAKSGLLTTVIGSLFEPAMRVNPDSLPKSLMAPASVEYLAHVFDDWCKCLDSTHYFFRLDWPNGALLTTTTTVGAADLAWARDTIRTQVKGMQVLADMMPTTFGANDWRRGAGRQLNYMLTNDSYVMILGEREGHPKLLVFVVSRDLHGQPIVIYGYETEPRHFLTPAFDSIYHKNALLPPSLIRGTHPDSVLTLAVTDFHGHPLFQSPGKYDPMYAAADTLDANFGRFILHVALRPDVADQLVVGGLPPSRLPVLVALIIVMATLLAIALVQLQREQELAQLRTEFVSGVSHELRTPLAQIRWFSELLHMGKLRSEEERVRSAGIIDQEARRLTYLVENVLNFSRAERRQNRVTPVPTDLEKELRDVLELFSPLAKSRQMKLRAEMELGLVAAVDRDALRQVWLNLLDNAAKYGPEGQTISVGSARDGAKVRIWVEDEGPGVPAAERERVWEPYVRLTHDATRATGGSGIGLSVVRELVELHGGHCRMEKSSTGGVRVVIELPALEAGVSVAEAT